MSAIFRGTFRLRSFGVSNWVNWLVIIVGLVCVTIELALGVLTGFDLALVGASLAVGGGIGLIIGSGTAGLLADNRRF